MVIKFEGMTIEAKRDLWWLLTDMIYAPMEKRGGMAVEARDQLLDYLLYVDGIKQLHPYFSKSGKNNGYRKKALDSSRSGNGN